MSSQSCLALFDHLSDVVCCNVVCCKLCRWHIEGEITHDWKKLAERKAKQLRKLSDTYKGQLDKVLPATAFLAATCSSSSCPAPLALT